MKKIIVYLPTQHETLLTEYMTEKLIRSKSAAFASLLVDRRDCRENHSKGAGRPRKNDDEIPPFVLPQRADTLSFTQEELKEIAKKSKQRK